jgi:putative peptide zinc metalloprotease protein
MVRGLIKLEFSIGNIDGMLARMYRRFGWYFFTRVGTYLILALVFGGIVAFSEARKHQRLFDVAGAGVWGIIAAVVGYVFALTIHELAHALAVKSYGRRVRRGGLMVMMGMPYAFVDTSDMWFEARRPRIVVSLAGPVATAAFGGLLAIGAATLPGAVIPGICFQVAFGLYINTLFNFNPLIPLDGYYVLIDLLGMPRLREEAGAYFRKGIWRDLRHGRAPSGRQLGLALYGAVALVGTMGFLFMGLFLWQTRLSGPIHTHVPAPLDQVIVVTGLLLLFFPTWYAPMTKMQRAIQRRRLARERLLEPAPA